MPGVCPGGGGTLKLRFDRYITDPLERFPPFSHDVTAATLVFQNNETAAMLVFQNNETAAMLVCQKSPLGVELFSYVNVFFCPNKFA